jgi:hypothetical protein
VGTTGLIADAEFIHGSYTKVAPESISVTNAETSRAEVRNKEGEDQIPGIKGYNF